MSKGKSMSLNTDDLKKFEQGVPEKISLSGSFDRNVPRNIRLMTSSAEFFRIDSAEKKLSVCLDWRCTLRKNIIEFMVVVVQATLLISIGYSWFYASLIAGIAGIGGIKSSGMSDDERITSCTVEFPVHPQITFSKTFWFPVLQKNRLDKAVFS